MKISSLDAQALHARLIAPMRSRGDVGFTEFFHTGSEHQRVTAVTVRTDAGGHGVTLLRGDAREWLDTVARPSLIGRDPRSIRHLRAALRQRQDAVTPGGDRSGWSAAGLQINRLEFALWDLLGRSAGLPLFRLLGGTDPRVAVYAGGGSLCWNPLPELLDETRRLLARGFRALKIKIGHGPEEDAEIIRAIREACGPGVRIMVDANRAYDLRSALRLCPVLEAQDVYWLEEPFVYEEPEAWRELRRRTTVRVAGGEAFSTLSAVAEALDAELAAVLQCDAGAFGLADLLAIAALAQERGVALTPHCCNSAIGFVVAAHLQRALANAEVQELETFDNPFIDRIFAEPRSLRDGCVVLPETPGLGVELDPRTLAEFAVD
jgi:L-alanine-DL-glutamate epimerase-like enolase superfamily enzyme